MVFYRRRPSWPVSALPFAVPRPVLTDWLLRSIGPVGRDEPSGLVAVEWLITAGANTLRIWDVVTGTLRHTVVSRPGGRIQAVAATSTLVATAVNHTRRDQDWGEVRVHAVDTGDLLTTAVVYGRLYGCRWTETGLHAHGTAGLYAFSWIT